LVDQLVEDGAEEEVARALCRKLAGFSPVAVQALKAAVRQALEAPLSAGLAYENEMNVLCFAAGDHHEGIRAFVEKRDPAFKR
jgi:enoyl-CoA hydratase/carnithine racemase